MFNFHVYTLNLAAGKEQPDLRGLWAAPPPKRVGRNRNGDQFFLLLRLEGQAALPPQQETEILQKVAASFYHTAGSVTFALRAAADSLNELLLERNLKTAKQNGQITATANMAVYHGDILNVAHCGPTYSFILGRSQVEVYRDAQTPRGLGLSKQVSIRFYQSQVQAGELLLMSHRPPASWTTEMLAGSTQIGMDHIRRRLLNQAGSDMEAVLIRLQPGKGELNVSSLLKVAYPAGREPVEEQPPEPQKQPEPLPVTILPEPPTNVVQMSEESLQPETAVVEPIPATNQAVSSRPRRTDGGPIQRLLALRQRSEQVKPAKASTDRPQGVYLAGEPARKSEPQPAVEIPSRQRHERTRAKPVERVSEQAPEAPARASSRVDQASAEAGLQARRFVGTLWNAGSTAQRKTAAFGRKAVLRIAPTKKEELPRLSPGAMWFVALAIPLVIAVVAATVYIRKGYGEQHLVYLAQAQEFASQAENQPDQVLKRQDWMQALQWVSKADVYGTSEESTTLRNQAQQALDSMDGIRRIDFEPASPTTFDRQINISKMVASGDDIYLLDKAQGRIFRLAYMRPGYDIDPQFNCGPGQLGDGGLIIGPLIDLEPIKPNNSHGASVMGLDQMGNLLFCAPNLTPEAITLAAPDSGWLNLSQMTISNNTLYILDPTIPGVWRYPGNGVDFFEAPRLFFDQEVPPLQDVIDLAVYQDDLFLLHQDGHMTKCTYSEFDFSPTRCTDPFPFNMQASGQSGEPVMTIGQPISQTQTTESPAYSLFLFSGDAPAIYHFSLALNLQAQYRPQLNGSFTLPNRPATSFLITPSRRILIAFGNEVFYGSLP